MTRREKIIERLEAHLISMNPDMNPVELSKEQKAIIRRFFKERVARTISILRRLRVCHDCKGYGITISAVFCPIPMVGDKWPGGKTCLKCNGSGRIG